MILYDSKLHSRNIARLNKLNDKRDEENARFEYEESLRRAHRYEQSKHAFDREENRYHGDKS